MEVVVVVVALAIVVNRVASDTTDCLQLKMVVAEERKLLAKTEAVAELETSIQSQM